MAKRIQRKRTKGSKMPKGAVYVGRPTKWGNPFAIGKAVPNVTCGIFTANVRATTRDEAVQGYERWLSGQWVIENREPPSAESIRAALADRDLCCFCPLDRPCHADVLLAIAAEGGPANV